MAGLHDILSRLVGQPKLPSVNVDPATGYQELPPTQFPRSYGPAMDETFLTNADAGTLGGTAQRGLANVERQAYLDGQRRQQTMLNAPSQDNSIQ